MRISGHGQSAICWTRARSKTAAAALGISESGVADSVRKKTLFLGECKWGPQVMGRSALRDLVEKTVEIVPAQGKWTIYYLGFARSGWTGEAQQYADELAGKGPKGDNWQALGMRLLDLRQVDQDLADWTV